MLRSIFALLAFAVLSVSAPDAMRVVQAAGKAPCEAPDAAGDQREIRCTLSASTTPQPLRFTANFSGSHDDTMLSMNATLDGAPLTCDAGSRTELMGEDGDVSLICRFTLAARAGASHVLAVSLTWRHAQYAGFTLDAE